MKTIFYSWQSDLPSEINQQFIEKCIESAIERLNDKYKIEESPRNHKIKMERDVKDTPGSPSIVDTIFNKIDKCSLFIADLTFVARTSENPKTKKKKKVPNPNVLIEYGYATKALGENRILSLMNTEFGEPEEESLPFNIRHKKWPIQYKLAVNHQPDEKVLIENALVKSLYQNMDTILEHEPTSHAPLQLELIENDSKYYLMKDKWKILFTPCLKIGNLSSENVSVKIDSLEAKILGNWVNTDKSTFRGGMITTSRGAVSRHQNEFIDKNKDIRIEGFGSEVIYDAFDINIKPIKEEFSDKDPIEIKVYVKSLDGRDAILHAEIDAY